MLNQKQQTFVYEYLKNRNATQAYKTAYGVQNDEQAAVCASKLLRNAKVLAEIEMFKRDMKEKTAITIEAVVSRINDLAENADRDSDKLKALDMLMKHLGAYYTLQDIIERLTPEQVEQLHKKLVEYIKTDNYERER